MAHSLDASPRVGHTLLTQNRSVHDRDGYDYSSIASITPSPQHTLNHQRQSYRVHCAYESVPRHREGCAGRVFALFVPLDLAVHPSDHIRESGGRVGIPQAALIGVSAESAPIRHHRDAFIVAWDC